MNEATMHAPESSKEPRQVQYHQVSLFKFFVLSLLTLNVYTYYWIYKCWVYVRKQEGGGLHSFLRTLFAPLTFASLLKRI